MSLGAIMCSPGNASAIPFARPLWQIEENFDNCANFTFLSDNWKVIYVFITVYLVAIFAGQRYMKSRPPFQLRGALLAWNVALATYSIVSAWRMVPNALHVMSIRGMHSTSCSAGSIEERKSVGLWIFLFIVSKVVEFGDTAFIVLRKQPLIILHWYHHITVAFFVWSSGAYASPMQGYFTAVNLVVHSVMYTYYCLKVLRIRVPRPVSMAITSLQLVQMMFGIYITWYMYRAKTIDPTCLVTDEGIAIAVAIYISYLVLFSNFFAKTYLSKKPKSASNGTSKNPAINGTSNNTASNGTTKNSASNETYQKSSSNGTSKKLM